MHHEPALQDESQQLCFICLSTGGITETLDVPTSITMDDLVGTVQKGELVFASTTRQSASGQWRVSCEAPHRGWISIFSRQGVRILQPIASPDPYRTGHSQSRPDWALEQKAYHSSQNRHAREQHLPLSKGKPWIPDALNKQSRQTGFAQVEQHQPHQEPLSHRQRIRHSQLPPPSQPEQSEDTQFQQMPASLDATMHKISQLNTMVVALAKTVYSTESLTAIARPYRYGKVRGDFHAAGPGELDLNTGDIVKIISWEDKNWWYGCRQRQSGYFPASFVRVVHSSLRTAQHRRLQRIKREKSRRQSSIPHSHETPQEDRKRQTLLDLARHEEQLSRRSSAPGLLLRDTMATQQLHDVPFIRSRSQRHDHSDSPSAYAHPDSEPATSRVISVSNKPAQSFLSPSEWFTQENAANDLLLRQLRSRNPTGASTTAANQTMSAVQFHVRRPHARTATNDVLSSFDGSRTYRREQAESTPGTEPPVATASAGVIDVVAETRVATASAGVTEIVEPQVANVGMTETVNTHTEEMIPEANFHEARRFEQGKSNTARSSVSPTNISIMDSNAAQVVTEASRGKVSEPERERRNELVSNFYESHQRCDSLTKSTIVTKRLGLQQALAAEHRCSSSSDDGSYGISTFEN